jgi:GNAT superfamily N-acetyltransferase
MRPADIIAADALAWAALQMSYPVAMTAAEEQVRVERQRVRHAHLLQTDPGGAWLAEAEDAPIGVALSFVREGLWGLSLLAVAPAWQGRGIGGRLLRAALEHGQDARGGLIVSSTDPRAMRRYARAGFALRPCLAASGPLNRSRIPSGLAVRDGDHGADAELLAACSRRTRGAAHGSDLPAIAGGELLVVDGRGFAIARDGSPALIAALDEDAATALLWGCLATGRPGAFVSVGSITAGNDWAMTTALDAGLTLEAEGPLCTRGVLGTLVPYLPSGSFL